ncbi:MAG TPA: carboxypeptidase regulatory-like domain-containing protein, partial [Acidobacteriaceae bacterium]|nr:carboxypeptidase regulatory-like domain-containing protein [Acidobacteriaceae bacterium]
MLRLVPLQGRNILFLCLIGLVACTLAHRLLLAQSTTGGLTGTVFDPAHAVLPDAHIFLKNEATGAVLLAVSDAVGNYRFVNLAPGNYGVGVDVPGFAFFESPHVVVELGRQTRLDVVLRIAAAKTTVQVATNVVPFEKTTSPDFSTNFTSSDLLNLPSDSRRWSSFALLSPGVVSDQNGLGLLSFRGISVLLNNSTIDGADNNQAFFSEERGGTRAPYSISMGAVEQFQVNTSNYSAEYGRSAGGVINTITKSGSNALHGKAFIFDRNSALAATNPFTTLTTAGPSGAFATAPYKPAGDRRQMGFSVGGPIKKDRLFGFYSFEYVHKNYPAISRVGSPAAVFAQPLASIPAGTYLGFPITCANLPPYNDGGGSSSTPATSAFYSSVFQFEATQGACEIYDRLDMPSYQAGVAQYQKGLQLITSLSGVVQRTGSQTLNFPKLDWQINNRNHASFAYNRMHWNSLNGVQTQSSAQYGINSFGNDTLAMNWMTARLNSFLTENIGNEVRLHYGQELGSQTSPTPTGAEIPLAHNQFGYAPEIRIAGGSGGEGIVLGNPAKLPRPEYPNEHRMQVSESLSWVRGNHLLKFGADWDRNYDV